MSSTRREITATVLLALLAAVGLFVAAGARWAHGTGRRPVGSAYVAVHAAVDGRDVAGIVEGVAILALVGALGVFATRGLGRVGLGVLLAAGGVAGVVGAVTSRSDAQARVARRLPAGASVVADPWWVLAVVAAVLLVAAGAVLVVRGRGWSTLSARHQAPAARARTGDAWDALDRGEDPTA